MKKWKLNTNLDIKFDYIEEIDKLLNIINNFGALNYINCNKIIKYKICFIN